jgi:glucose/arabinose dehydrogenase
VSPRVRLLLLVLPCALALGCGCGAEGNPGQGSAAQPAVTPAAPPAKPAASHGVKLVRIGNFKAPVYLTAPPGDRTRLFVVEQGGRIKVLHKGTTRTFLDISSDVQSGGERGLLSMAFAPDYKSSRRFYVYFTDNTGDIRIQEFRSRTDDVANKSSRRDVVHQAHRQFPNHNGGQLAFGPDGFLYTGFGDGGGGGDILNNGQNLHSLLGKILRIDPHAKGGRPYTIPAGNPFLGHAGRRPEIWSFGLRNPYRFSFDRLTGDMAIGDVGQDKIEEIDFTRRGRSRGANFGWPHYEGNSRFRPGSPRGVRPVITTSHANGNCSIIGGYVVRDRGVPGLFGRYVYGDYCNPKILSARLSTGRASGNRSTGLSVSALSSFGEDARGRVYAVSLSGPVYRFAAR